jgi:type II secretory pathway component PulF
MFIYRYKGIKDNKYTEGYIKSQSKNKASLRLKEQKVIITSLKKVEAGFWNKFKNFFK